MKTVEELKQELVLLRKHLSGFEDYEHNIIFDQNDPEDVLLADKINDCLEMAGDLERQIADLTSEVFIEGRLALNEDGRYEIDGFTITSGQVVEFWEDQNREWQQDRIEHSKNCYYLYHSHKNLDKIYARIRKA